MLSEKRLNCKTFSHVCKGENKQELFLVLLYKSKETYSCCVSHTHCWVISASLEYFIHFSSEA